MSCCAKCPPGDDCTKHEAARAAMPMVLPAAVPVALRPPQIPIATRQQVLTQARSYMGVRFKHLGRTREEGLDCFGLIIRVAWDLGLSSFTLAGYHRIPHPASVRAHCQKQMTEKPVYQMQPGDVVLMAHRQWVCHLAFIGDLGRPFSLIQADSDKPGVSEVSLTLDLSHRIHACYQLPNIAEVGA